MSSAWFPFGAPEPADPAGLRLLCLPHAGAGASTYLNWGRGLPAGIAAVPVQLPGREGRMRERPYDRVEPLVRDLAEAVLEQVRPPFAIFGHSLGALVGYELTRRLADLGGPGPVHLFVSGRQAPQHATSGAPMRDLDVPALVTELARLGGTPQAVLDDPDLLALIAPLLRADFAVNETYRFAGSGRPAEPLAVPITAFAATADPRVTAARMTGWAEHTATGFRLHRLPGGHFAVLQHASFVHARIAEALRAAAARPELSPQP